MMGGQNVLVVPEVIQIAKDHGVSAAQVGLRWIVQQNIPLACASWRLDYMKEDLDLWSFRLTDDEMRTLSDVQRRRQQQVQEAAAAADDGTQ